MKKTGDWYGHKRHRDVPKLTEDAHSFIPALDEVDLARLQMPGRYTRSEEAVLNVFDDAQPRSPKGFDGLGRGREHHLIRAARLTDKTYFPSASRGLAPEWYQRTEVTVR